MGEPTQRRQHLSDVISDLCGMDFVNAKKVINTKLKNQQPNPTNMSLAERILLNRRKGGRPEPRRQDSMSGSVDISDLTNHTDERRTPTPEPTVSNHRRSPLKRQDTKQSVAPEQPGPSHRKSATPPLPPIKSASPRPESKNRTPVRARTPVRSDTRQSRVESRRETPVLPPIAKDEPKRDSPKFDNMDEIQPPRDTREFDPDLGVGADNASVKSATPSREETQKREPQTKTAVTPVQESRDNQVPKPEAPRQKTLTPEPVVAKPPSPAKAKEPTPPPQQQQEKPATPRTEQPTVNNSETTIVPVVAPIVAAAASDRRRSRSRSRSRSRRRSRSRSETRSRSRSKKRSRRKSRSRSRSKRKSRKSRSKRHYTSSSSYSSSSSPRRRRRHSYSPDRRRHRSRGRSRSRRRSFDYDFERAKSIVRSISRMGSFSRRRSPSVEYIIGGTPRYWPQQRQMSPRKKKKIIIVQNGALPQLDKRRDRSSSGSDINIVVTNPKSKSKNKKYKKGRTKYTKQIVSSDSEESSETSESEDETVKKDKKKKKNTTKQKNKRNKKEKKAKHDSDESEVEEKNKKLRFNLNNVKPDRSEPNEEVTESNAPKQIKAQVARKQTAGVPVVESKPEVESASRDDKNAPKPDKVPKSQTPLLPKSPNTAWGTPRGTPRQTPVSKPVQKANPVKKKNPKHDENELREALKQLEKRSDFELEQLKGGNVRKLPPDVNLKMKNKIFSEEFQQNIDNFLQS